MMKLSTSISISLFISSSLVVFAQETPQIPLLMGIRGNNEPRKRVAVIGAGAGGTSACYFFNHDLNINPKSNKQNPDQNTSFSLVNFSDSNVDITLYDKNRYIGGRSITVNVKDDPRLPMELGASIFVEANKHLMTAVKVFNLETYDKETFTNKLGIWDGEKFVYTESGWKWWNIAKLLWKYGYSPAKMSKIVTNVVEKFINIYDISKGPWTSIEEIGKDLGLLSLTNKTGMEYFLENGISESFLHDFIDGATRVNYGQNIDKIHALEGSVSLAAVGAYSVRGGNFQILEQFARRSHATIRLNTKIKRITKMLNDTKIIYKVEAIGGEINYYDTVIMAAPLHLSGIEFINMPNLIIGDIEYVQLYVTLFSTKGSANSSYFNMTEFETVPDFILTSSFGDKEPEFNSLSKHMVLEDSGEWVWKMFSAKYASNELLERIMGSGNITWIHRHVWDAYPILSPRTEFPKIEPEPGFFYLNSFEPFISTMETETVSAKNIVRLIKERWFGNSSLPRAKL